MNDYARIRTISAWIVALVAFAGPFWPHPLGLLAMSAAFFGLIHLSVLIGERLREDQIQMMNAYEFEYYCAKILSKRKWRTQVTRASHDQGVDIIAKKGDLCVVFQCKKYAKPVGNHAVQQIVAAIAHTNAQRGAVIATSSFTPSAKTLAASNNILLLHHTELLGIDRLLKRSAISK